MIQNWDPIGIKDEPKAQDEYDIYVPQIVGMMIDGKTAEEISDYLDKIERINMGGGSNRDRSLKVSRTLKEIEIDNFKTEK